MTDAVAGDEMPGADANPDEVLAWVAGAAPRHFFPSQEALHRGQPPEALEAAIWRLCREGLVEVCDWVKGAGQGFRLTSDGLKAYELRQKQACEPEPQGEAGTEILPEPGLAAKERLLNPTAPFVTPLLIVAHLVWFVYGAIIAIQSGGSVEYLLGNSDPVVGWILQRLGAISGGAILDGEAWRFLTFGFVHVGLFHLIGNLVILALLGSFAEGVWGQWRFAVIYVLSGIGGAIVMLSLNPQAELAGANADVLMGGASGSLWGVTISTLVWLTRNLKLVPRDVTQDWIRKVSIVAVMNLIVSFYPGINVFCIFGGGVSGLAIAIAVSRIDGWHWRSLLALLGFVGLMAGGVVALTWAMSHTTDWQDVHERHAQRQKQRQRVQLLLDADGQPKRP